MSEHAPAPVPATSGASRFDERLTVPWWWYLPAIGVAVLLAAEVHMGYPGVRAWIGYVVLVPLSVLGMFYPGRGPVVDTLSFAVFILILVLMWRLTNASIGKGAGVASAVFGFTLVSSMVLIVLLQGLLGLDALVTPG